MRFGLRKKPPKTSVPTAVPAELADWFRLVQVTHTSPETLELAQRAMESLPENKIQKLMALGMRHLRAHPEEPGHMNNLKHVEDQLLRPVLQDAEDLAASFGVDPTRFRLLVILHDLGKAGIPPSLLETWRGLFPDDYVAREILTHEYASMAWLAPLAREAELTDADILALQQLIANHNFGPDLCLPQNKALRAHWWPSKFREKIIPVLRDHGYDLSTTFRQSEDGEWQYNHAEDNVYTALLAAYDRAIATKYNVYGVSTWQKFAQQDYSHWQSQWQKQQSVRNPFSAVALTETMYQAAKWAETEIHATWNVLEQKHLLPTARASFQLKNFGPFRYHIDGIQRLLSIIDRVRRSNPDNEMGILSYTTDAGETWRVEDKRPRVGELKAQLKIWDPVNQQWSLVAEDQSPIKLFFQILQGDL